MKFNFLLILISCSIINCTSNVKSVNELYVLVEKEKVLLCELSTMKNNIAHEWDEVSKMLETQLPEDTPPEEKSNMLNARNANLIRMFESYKEMDDEIKTTLSETEQKDQRMGLKIIEIKQELLSLEKERMNLFEKVKRENGAQKLGEFQEFREKTINEKCLL